MLAVEDNFVFKGGGVGLWCLLLGYGREGFDGFDAGYRGGYEVVEIVRRKDRRHFRSGGRGESVKKGRLKDIKVVCPPVWRRDFAWSQKDSSENSDHVMTGDTTVERSVVCVLGIVPFPLEGMVK